MLELGPHKGRIVGHSTCQLGGKDAIRIVVDIAGEPTMHNVTIFLTEKSIGIARASLKACGFDCDAHDLGELDAMPPMLAGNVAPLMAEEYNGKLRLAIDLNQRIEPKRLSALTKSLRDVKKRHDDDRAPGGTPPPRRDRDANRPVEDYGDIPF